VSQRSETSAQAERPREEPPPGQFISEKLQDDCWRFLQEIKDVVRRRSEAGLARPPS
jgi:hypothetical protein